MIRQAVPSKDPSESATNAATSSTVSQHDGVRDKDDTVINSTPDHELLVVWQGIALLTADCMGVGVLGLPNDIKTLGYAAGFAFLLGNFPINFYAGNLLSILALDLERQHEHQQQMHQHDKDDENDSCKTTKSSSATSEVEMSQRSRPQTTSTSPTIHKQPSFPQRYAGLSQDHNDEVIETIGETNGSDKQSASALGDTFQDEDMHVHNDHNITTTTGVSRTSKADLTKDLIHITESIFHPSAAVASAMVKALYYTNLFLVLGDYILVMGRSVSAMFADQICLPTAGAIASILMFGLCQLRTMANLGRTVSLASLLALVIVLMQCLFHHRTESTGNNNNGESENAVVLEEEEVEDDIWGKFSSLAGIGFAVGSQKLFLNVRNALRHREDASKVLAGSLGVYGLAYVLVILLAGPDPPSFLFDSIPEGWSRRLAGLLLWFHVAVSYAINSQALCASLDQLLEEKSVSVISPWWSNSRPAVRWFGLTLAVSISSYLVSNAIPFFKDLVGLIGALTSVPLSLTLPAMLHRRANHMSLMLPDLSCISTGSYLLFLYSLAFLGVGLVGAISSINEDWLDNGSPFSCR